MPTANRGPDDMVLLQYINAYIRQTGAPTQSRFEYTRVDLNYDGMRDALVLFKSPHRTWCGWSGCMMIGLRATPDGFELFNEFDGIRGPLIISDLRTNGWRDLIVRVSNDRMADRNVVLQFDGQSYPRNPQSQTGIARDFSQIPGTRVFP